MSDKLRRQQITNDIFNSLWPSDVNNTFIVKLLYYLNGTCHMASTTFSSWVQTVAYLFGKQAIDQCWNMLSFGPSGTNFIKISINVTKFSLKKKYLNMLSAICPSFCSFWNGLRAFSGLKKIEVSHNFCWISFCWMLLMISHRCF